MRRCSAANSVLSWWLNSTRRLQIGPLYISDTTGQIGWGEMPEIGWPPPGDLAAEEAFSVYDHPPVWIFAKTEAYSRENTVAILGEVDLSQTVFMNPGQATDAPNGLMLSETAVSHPTSQRHLQRNL